MLSRVVLETPGTSPVSLRHRLSLSQRLTLDTISSWSLVWHLCDEKSCKSTCSTVFLLSNKANKVFTCNYYTSISLGRLDTVWITGPLYSNTFHTMPCRICHFVSLLCLTTNQLVYVCLVTIMMCSKFYFFRIPIITTHPPIAYKVLQTQHNRHDISPMDALCTILDHSLLYCSFYRRLLSSRWHKIRKQFYFCFHLDVAHKMSTTLNKA